MKNPHLHPFSLFLALAAVLAAWQAPAGGGAAVRIKDGSTVTIAQMDADMTRADVIFLGELHHRASDHLHQLQFIERLHEADVPFAIGLEMFRADSQKYLDAWTGGALSLEKFLPRYYDNWALAWPLYRPLFLYAREHNIPMVGLKISDRISSKVARSGYASLTPAERKALPEGVTCTVDRTYQEFIRKAYRTHPIDQEQFSNFCEAQMVWDQSMASHIIAYLGRNAGRKMVVLTGVGHAWRRGIPEQVARRSKLVSLVILPTVEGELERSTVTVEDADYLLLGQ